MKVALTNPYPYYAEGTESTTYPPLGILYIGAYIEELVDSLLIYDGNALKTDVECTFRRLMEFKPDIIGISVNIATSRAARELAVKIKEKYSEVFIVMGGPLPTACPDDWVEYCDVVIVGEGEIPFYKIVECKINGNESFIEEAGIFVKGKEKTFGERLDVDNIPFPAYRYLEPALKYYSDGARLRRKNMAPLLTSRGCPFNCIFCDKSVMGSGFRPRSPEAVIKEIRWLRKEFGVNQLDIMDDNFTFDIERANKILDALIDEKGYWVNCQNGLRADRLTPELVKKMKQAGVFRVGIGIESGSPDILKKINKSLSLEQVRKAIKWLRKEKITVHGYFILGFPFESASDIEKTQRFAVESNPHFANFSLFLPFPGSKIYNELKNNGQLLNDRLDEINTGFFRDGASTKLEYMTSGELKVLYGKTWKIFYFRVFKFIDILKTIGSWHELCWVMRIGQSIIKRNIIKFK